MKVPFLLSVHIFVGDDYLLALPGEAISVRTEIAERTAQGETYAVLPLGVPFPVAKFADKYRLTADTFVGEDLV